MILEVLLQLHLIFPDSFVVRFLTCLSFWIFFRLVIGLRLAFGLRPAGWQFFELHVEMTVSAMLILCFHCCCFLRSELLEGSSLETVPFSVSRSTQAANLWLQPAILKNKNIRFVFTKLNSTYPILLRPCTLHHLVSDTIILDCPILHTSS